MACKLTELLTARVLPDDGRFRVAEIFYNPGTWRFRYVALDAGSWLDRREVLISIDHFGQPADGEWPVDLTRDRVEAAPQWDEAPANLAEMPPIVVGPFGNTFSPMLLAAQWADAERAVPDDPGRTQDNVLARRVDRMDRAGPWIGREVFGPEGAMGEVADMMVSDDWTLSDMVTRDGTVIPLARLHRLADQGHVVVR